MADDTGKTLTHDPLHAAYGEVASTLERAKALPGPAFTDPRVFAAEARLALAGEWLPVARLSELAQAGDYRSADLAGVPVVATRDAAGEIRVLSRLCRHRGAPVVEGTGNAKALTCPYHLWRYALDGRLAAAPAMERSTIFARESLALPEIRSCQWGGWLFANLDGQAPPLASRVAGLEARLAPYDLAGMVTAEVVTFESPWNWKLMVENFMESYHHIGPHAGSLQKTHPGLGTWVAETDELYTVLENPPVDETGHPFLVATLFPATLLAIMEGPNPSAIWYEMDAIEHGRFTLRIHLMASPERAADPVFLAVNSPGLTAIHLEDVPPLEAAQKAVFSPFYEPGPLSHLEGSLWRFHRFLQARLLTTSPG